MRQQELRLPQNLSPFGKWTCTSLQWPSKNLFHSKIEEALYLFLVYVHIFSICTMNREMVLIFLFSMHIIMDNLCKDCDCKYLIVAINFKFLAYGGVRNIDIVSVKIGCKIENLVLTTTSCSYELTTGMLNWLPSYLVWILVVFMGLVYVAISLALWEVDNLLFLSFFHHWMCSKFGYQQCLLYLLICENLWCSLDIYCFIQFIVHTAFRVDQILGCEMCRTPDIAAIHHDTSPDLRVVGSKLKNILNVCFSVSAPYLWFQYLTFSIALRLCIHAWTCDQPPLIDGVLHHHWNACLDVCHPSMII